MKNPFKEFGPSSWSINNKTSIYILTIIITFAGIMTYIKLPKEQFPDIVIPTIYVNTVYPGTSPTDMENLVTRELEKKIKAVSGVKKVTSNSVQDYSNVIVEFNAGIKVEVARQRVKDAVDKAKNDLPEDLPNDPMVNEINFSDIPIMYVNIAGDYENGKLKRFADLAKDKIEGMKEITRVDMAGALQRELKIDVDMYKMQAAQLTMGDIDGAVRSENLTMSGGLVKVGDMKRSVRIEGEFKTPEQVGNIIVKTMKGSPIYIKDVAEVKYAFEEKESYARLNHNSVITLSIVKKAGENLINASDKVRVIMKDLQDTKYPPGLSVVITGDQSSKTRVTLADLINSIVIGFILVTIVLMFFMGTTNALFVALSVPLSMLVAFLVIDIPLIGFSMNMIVLFAFLFALGIVVDDAIVVIENTHRIYHDEHLPIADAAKKAAGEIFVPVLSGTLTTLAPFIPLTFLPGMVGKFMFYLPITLIITLIASLIVAFIINPVFAVSFMKKDEADHPEKGFVRNNRGLVIASVIFVMIALIFYISKNAGMGNFSLFMMTLLWINKFIFSKWINGFQNNIWPKFMNVYEKMVRGAIEHSGKLIWGTVALFFLTLGLTVAMAFSGALKLVFFPKGDPNFVYVYIAMPIGTDQVITDSVTKLVEEKVYKVVGEKNPVVESVIANVTIGVTDPSDPDRSPQPNKAKVTVAFVEFAKRGGKSTRDYLDRIRNEVKGMPGVQITVDQEKNGPPTGKPVNIEVVGDEFEDLVSISNNFIRYIDSLQIKGIEELKSDLVDKKPEIVIEIDRERAKREGLSTAIIGSEVRSAIFGKEVSKYRDGEDQYKIMLRYEMNQRNKIDDLLNMKITFRDMAMGGAIRQIPLSSVASFKYSNTYGAIKRKDQKRLVTISSNVLTGYNPNEIVSQIEKAIPGFKLKEGYEIKLTGEQEDQKETMNYLGFSLLLSLGMIFMILVTQFNSISKSVIILTEIAFSVIGVLLGYIVFRMEFVIIMTGIGVVGLAGIVVKNGILLVEFTDELRGRGYKLKRALIEAGKIRLTPVILTAMAAILGLIPMAVGFNIDFVSLFQHFEPHIHFGGDNVAFWGPLSWTIIFGLSFATFLTLLLVPAMYYRVHLLKIYIRRKLNKMNFKRGKWPKAGATPPHVLSEKLIN